MIAAFHDGGSGHRRRPTLHPSLRYGFLKGAVARAIKPTILARRNDVLRPVVKVLPNVGSLIIDDKFIDDTLAEIPQCRAWCKAVAFN